MKVLEPTLLLLRQKDNVPSIIIFRATVFAMLLTRSSSVARYVVKDANVSSKKMIHSGPKFGAPLKSVSEDASRKDKMLYIKSAEPDISSGFKRAYCSSGKELRRLDAVACYTSALIYISIRLWLHTLSCVRMNSAILVNSG